VRRRLAGGEALAMEFIEDGLRSAVHRDAAAMLARLLNDPRHQGPPEECRPGEKRYRRRTKELKTLFGPILLERDYFCVPGAGEGRAPLDQRLGLIEGYSPALARIMVRIAAQQSFQAAQLDLKAYANVEVEGREIARMVDRLAPQMQAVRGAAAPPAAPCAVPILYVQADGAGVPVRKREAIGHKAKEGEGDARTREVKLGCVFTQSVTDEKGNPLRDPDSTTYVASFEPAADFGGLLRAEAFARGMAAAQQIVFIGDGAAWVWELARVNFPQAICILDFYHACEHLGTLAESLYGAGTHKSRSRSKRWRSLLKEDRIDAIVSRAKADLPMEAAARETAEKQLAYFEKNRERMLYATFRAKGFFIGSGIVEAGCKTVVAKRVKNSGMFWTVEGAQNVLTLRTALLGRHFEADWAARSQAVA
jgi:hypothetical protein